ncbi:ras-related protein Rap-2a-like isoform X2 [Argiope bruennichi]|nr:ras-related protein Rap-2a-like isoform X2 [Argiope bruennichi]
MGSSRENKLVVLGPGGVGKTSLVVQYLEGFFTSTYKPTVEDYYRHTIKMPDGAFHTVQILDTAGSLNFPAMRELSIRSGRGFILVFSVDNLQSFHEAIQLWDLIQRIRGENVPVVLVGNKTDLASDRVVTQEMVAEVTKDPSRICRYIETSAKSNDNVSTLFQELLLHAQELEQPPPQPHSSRRLSRRLSSLGSINFVVRRKSSVPREGEPKEKPDSKSCVIV